MKLDPEKDITLSEMVMIIALSSGGITRTFEENTYNNLPTQLKRHFIQVD